MSGWNTQALTNYEKQLDDHYFKVMAGMECQTYTEKTLSAYRQVFNFPQYDQIDAGIKFFALYFFFNVTSLISTTPPLFWERIAT